jgi:biopolymer transport protein ExbD
MQTLLKNYQHLSAEPEHEVMMDINTTPLIDVMLVLLIMFIVTIPIQLHSVKLDLPRPAATTPKVDPVIISVFVDTDHIHWNGTPEIDLAQATQNFAALQAMDPQPELHVRSHPDAHYEAVATLMAQAQKSGLKKIGITDTQAYP